jgi:molecular chaperone DnaK
MSEIIGIDLGTTMSVVARFTADGKSEIVYDEDGNNLTPSVVSVGGPDPSSWVVGAIAKDQLFDSPECTFGRFKREMGTDTTWPSPAGPLSPTALSAGVLRKLKSVAEAHGSIANAVVTIPANFGNQARQATTEAASQAGLYLEHIINEPTAAALYFAHAEGSANGKYAVFDLGGGTFDVTILEIRDSDVDVIATEGIHSLGGVDFDEKIKAIVHQAYEQETGSQCQQADYSPHHAEQDKIHLSKSDSKRIRVRGDGGAANITITREQFEEAISSELAQIELLCESVLEEAGIERGSLEAVILAGGSTRIPAVQRAAERGFGQAAHAFSNPDEIVARGAALYAGMRARPADLTAGQAAAVGQSQLAERTAMCFGTISANRELDPSGETQFNSVLIQRGEPIPCSTRETYYTVFENQGQVLCRVTESARPETEMEFVQVIWEGPLTLKPGRPANSPIHITFSFDANQIMHVSFQDGDDGGVVEADLKLTGQGGSSAAQLRVD